MNSDILTNQFVDALNVCRHQYVDKTIACVMAKPDLDCEQIEFYFDEIQQRFDQLLIKIFVEVAWSDCIWSNNEGELAKVLLERAFKTRINDRELQSTLEKLYQINSSESWQAVLEPFTILDELIESRPALESSLMKMANIVAKIDGNVTAETIGQLKNIQWQIHQFLDVPREIDYSTHDQQADEVRELIHEAIGSAIAEQKVTAGNDSGSAPAVKAQTAEEKRPAKDPAQQQALLEEAMAELDKLVGIKEVKQEVKTMVNFLKVQKARKEAGLPANEVSLHMVFEGNPGTGKTTVARILGRVLGAMGVLDRGHLVETDRSGLVAEFVGQTATKTNKIIDEAIDGVLFIDEAYSLVGDAKDSFGAEAIQALLKRAEDDRDRLIVILAGYSDPMRRLLRTNPGLSSRFSRTFNFPDYAAQELCEIFEILATKNHYVVPPEVRALLHDHLARELATRDEHFGNGRVARNIFETAMRSLANRVVDIPDLTPELLTTLCAEDLQLDA